MTRQEPARDLVRAAVNAVESLERRLCLSAVSNWQEVAGRAGFEALPNDELDRLGVVRQTVNGETFYALEDEYIVRMVTPAGKDRDAGFARDRLVNAFPGIEDVEELGGKGLFKVTVPGDNGLAPNALRNAAGVMYVEPNWLQFTQVTEPNDPRYPELYGLNNTGQYLNGTPDADIDAPEAWDLSVGSRNIVVGVIDTGIKWDHPDLAANIWTNPGEIPGDGIDNDGNGYVDDIHGYDFVNNDGNPMDDNRHGTHVAGTIGAVGNDGIGVVGVNWEVSMVGIKFLSGGGSGSTDNAIKSVQYANALADNGVNIKMTSNSWGGGGFSQALKDAIDASGTRGMLFIAAAGNSNSSSLSYPAGYDSPHIISVAASDWNDNRASFSNFGLPHVDIAAPGDDILSTSINGGGYETLSGTSMATPHVAGLAALAWSIDPSASWQTIQNAIYDGADTLPQWNGVVATGGRINALNTLSLLGLTVSSTTPAAGGFVSTPPTSFTLTFAADVDTASVQASDLAINGIPASSFSLVGTDTITFNFAASPVTTEGPQVMTIGKDAILRASDGLGTNNWTSTFYYDTLPMAVTAASPASGTLVALPMNTLRLDFNEAVDATSIQPGDLKVDYGSVTGVNVIDADTVEFLLSGLLEERTLNAVLPTGAIFDAHGNPMAEYAASFNLDYGQTPWPAEFKTTGVAGASAYTSDAQGFMGAAGDVDGFVINLDAGQSLSVLVNADATLRPTVTIFGPDGSPLASHTAAAAGERAYIMGVPAPTSGAYRVDVTGAAGTVGDWQLQVMRNALVEGEEFAGSNNTLPTAQNLDANLSTLPNGGGYTTVFGSLPGGLGTPILGESWESGTIGAAWTTSSSTTLGRIQVTSAQGASDGTRALLMDVSASSTPNLNEAIWTVNLAGRPQVSLTFDHAEWGDEEAAMPASFTGSNNSDGVAMSVDGTTWYRLWTPTSQTTGTWVPQQIDLTAAAAAAGISLNGNVQIKFQQFDDFSLTTDGRGWDNIQIRVPEANGDIYSFSGTAGQAVSFGLAGTITGGTLTLRDGTGAVVASGSPTSGTDFKQILEQVILPGTGTYYVEVGGAGQYNLLVGRGAVFNVEAGQEELIQELTPGEVAFGQVAKGAASGRLYAFNNGNDTIVEVDPQTGAILNSFPIPGSMSGFDAGLATTPAGVLFSGDNGPLYELDGNTGQVLRQIPYPSQDVSGIAFLDNEIFLLTDTGTARITVLDYNTGAVLRNVTPSVTISEGLTGGDGKIYGITSADAVYEFDPVTGAGTLFYTVPGVGSIEGMGIVGRQMYLADVDEVVVIDMDTKTVVNTWLGFDDLEGLGADGGLVDDTDTYAINAKAGDTITIRTGTPGGGAAGSGNTADLAVQVFDAAGNLVASDDNSAPDGRNAFLSFTPVADGVFNVVVQAVADGFGSYSLYVSGATGGPLPFRVVGGEPAPGGRVLDVSELVVKFSDRIDTASLDASDLVFNGQPASSVSVTGDREATFLLGTTFATEGSYTYSIAPGAILDQSGVGVQGFSAQVSVDRSGPRVLATSLTSGQVINPGNLSVDVTFDEMIDVSSLGSDDLVLTGLLSGDIEADSYSFNEIGKILTLNYSNLPEDAYTLRLVSGGIQDDLGNDLDGDANGTPGGDFELAFSSDISTLAMPAASALTGVAKLGYASEISGLIGDPADVDELTLNLDPGQMLSLRVTGFNGLTPAFTLLGPSGAVVATGTTAGTVATLNALNLPAGGIYKLQVASLGGSTGQFTVAATLNAATEAETLGGPSNDTRGTAQDVDDLFLLSKAGSGRAVILGKLPALAGVPIAGSNFDSGLPADFSTFSSNSQGRIRVIPDYSPGSGNAVIMDVAVNSTDNLNELVWSVDLTGRRDLTLAFDHAEWGDEEQPMPATFTGRNNSDGVAFSVDGTTWYRLWTPASQPTGEWRSFELDLSAAAASAGVSIDGPVLIKFQQFDNFSLETDGRGFDNVQLKVPAVNDDWYSFTSEAGAAVNATVTQTGPGAIDFVEAYDAAGNLLGTAAPDASGALRLSFTPTLAGTYYLRVSGSEATYDVFLGRRALLEDAAASGALATAQQLVIGDVAHGALAAGQTDHYRVDLSATLYNTFLPAYPGLGGGDIPNDLRATLELVDAGGNVVATGDRFGRVVYRPAADGTFYLRITPTSGAGAYRIDSSSSRQLPTIEVQRPSADLIRPTGIVTFSNMPVRSIDLLKEDRSLLALPRMRL